MSVHQQIMEQLSRYKGGKILFPTDFRGIGSDSAVKMSLSRIAGSGYIQRLSHGIYLKPKKGSAKTDAPTPKTIAEAIAEKENIKIKAAGDLALFQLGLIDKEPLDLTYVTDGEPRQISLGNCKIVFRPTTPKKLSMKGAVSSLVIQILEDAGIGNVTADLEKKVRESLSKEDSKMLTDDLKKAPAWIYQLLFNKQHKTNS